MKIVLPIALVTGMITSAPAIFLASTIDDENQRLIAVQKKNIEELDREISYMEDQIDHLSERLLIAYRSSGKSCRVVRRK